jgi:hypothetical protein
MPGMIGLTDAQLKIIMTAANGVPVERRDVFLQRVAALLRRQAGRFKSDDDVGRAVEIALSSLLMPVA